MAMTRNAEKMDQRDGSKPAAGTSPSETLQRPRIVPHHSNSLPATPRQHAHDFAVMSRSPSPPRTSLHHSPRSVSSGSHTALASLRPTNPACRFQSTQTSRRRMPYTIGSDPLGPDKVQPRKELNPFEEQNLTGEMRRLYDELLPSPTSQQHREQVSEKLKRILREEWPGKDVEVSVFGSSGNLLNTSKSDVDICITMKDLETVCALAELLAKRGMKNVTCVHAKAVPIVKIWDPQLKVACDLNVNNHVALKNTRMVRTYMEIDDRVRPLAMIIKYWTKRRIINEASGGTLSSYTWTLLVINFLQTRNVPILPVISLRDEHGHPKGDFSKDLERFRGYGRANNESLGELLFQFFRRYGHEIDYETAVMSVGQGKLLTKKEKKWHLATNNRLCVEEPFNTDRNLGNTADDTAFRGLHLELRQAFARIAEAKDLVSSVCEQFEYPAEEPRTIFERPQAGPRPILSRSASQSGRGNRAGGSMRGNRRAFDQRGGSNGRRSSSAAAFGPNLTFPMQSPQLLAAPDYFHGHNMPTTQEELQALSRKLSMEEQQLRYRQMLMSQQLQAQTLGSSHGRGAASPLPSQHRQLYNSGFPSPRLMQGDLQLGSAPLYPSLPFGLNQESPVSMSHSSSQQGTSTNPHSPMLAAATPHRHGLQRTAQMNSPGAAVRSQSQPARPMLPQPMVSMPSRAQNGPAGIPVQQHEQLWPGNIQRQPFVGPLIGPYITPHGLAYFPLQTAESSPREYLGYGMNGSPHLMATMPDQGLSQVPPYEDLMRQGRQSSPSRRHSSLGTSVSGPPRSPSPVPFDDLMSSSVHSAPLSGESLEHHDTPLNVPQMMMDEHPPLIVNGSNILGLSSSAEGIRQHRSISDSVATSQLPSLTQDDSVKTREVPALPAAQTASKQQVAQSEGSSTSTVRQETKGQDNSSQQSNKPAMPIQIPKPQPPAHQSSTDMPPPPRPLPSAWEKRSPKVRMSPETQNGPRRPPVPPLDLGPTPSERSLRDTPTAPPNGAVLSPVQETRTPSPAATRKHAARASLQLNGVNGAGTHSHTRTESAGKMPPPPTPLASASNATRDSAANSAPHRPLPVRASSSSSQSQNTWQQAGKKKKGRSAASVDLGRRGGEPMPANEAERKGG